jgi:membrane-bound inhibitor of C-type lysozyme
MYKKTVLLLGAILFVCAVATWLLVRDDSHEVQFTPTQVSEVFTYVSPESNDTITVAYSGDTATLEGLRYEAVPFVAVEAASGAKYVSDEYNLILWTKGNEVTLMRGRQTIFVGVDANQGRSIDTDESTGALQPAVYEEDDTSSYSIASTSEPEE